jgi:protein CpxP
MQATTASLFDARRLRTFAFGSVLAVAGTLALTAWAGPDGGHGRHGAHAQHAGFMMGGSPRHLERLLDSVDATEAQRSEVRRIAVAAAADMKAQREAGRALRERQLALFTQPTVDANAVEALRREMLTQHDRSSQRMTQAMVEASRVLTPEQRAQLAERMKSRRDLMHRHQRERRQLDGRQG